MKIGILLTGHPPEEIAADGRYDAVFQRLLGTDGFDYVTYSVVDGEMPPGTEAAEGWLITGSKHGAYEDHDWIPPLEGFIRDCYAAHSPMIGVCFGHQIIAQALGGTVRKWDKGWSIGRTEYVVDGTPMAMNAWHQDQVVERPEAATLIGSSDFCENAVLAYDDRMLTVQPHPEFDDTFIEGLIEHRAQGVVAPERIAQATASLGQPSDRLDFGQRMRDFYRKERA